MQQRLASVVFIVALASGCARRESIDAALLPIEAPSSASANAQPSSAETRRNLPLTALCTEFQMASPDARATRNSDGTPKHLPPPPPNDPGYALVLPYFDFGPQAMSFSLLGMSWWSWEPGGSFEPGDEFDVRVVIYQGRSKSEIEARYPTIKGKSDYRLIPRDAAIQYLDHNIAELATPNADTGEFDFGPLRQRLEQTRTTIELCLP